MHRPAAKMTAVSCATALGLGLVASLGFGGGLGGPLDDIRENVHSGSSNDDDDDDDDDSCVLCDVFVALGSEAASSSAGSAQVGDAGRAARGLNWPYPYYEGAPGYYLEAADANTRTRMGARKWNLRVQGGGAYIVQGLWRAGGGARAGWGMFEMDSAWDWLHDPRSLDSLTIGDFNLGVSALRGRNFALRAGVGGRLMFDSKPAVEGQSGPAAGFNATVGLTVFPLRPAVVALEADVGTLGEALYWKAGGRLGVMLGPLEVFAGADHTRIGEVGLTGVSFGMAGWF